MAYIQLFKNKVEVLGSDGVMYVDGRLNLFNVAQVVINRNKRFEVNFPNKIADSFGVYQNKIGSKIIKTVNL